MPKSASKPRVIHPKAPIEVLVWMMGDKTAFKCPVLPDACSTCGKQCVTVLPPPVAEQQTDGTTHVCHPSIGGCNQGFEITGPFEKAVKT